MTCLGIIAKCFAEIEANQERVIAILVDSGAREIIIKEIPWAGSNADSVLEHLWGAKIVVIGIRKCSLICVGEFGTTVSDNNSFYAYSLVSGVL